MGAYDILVTEFRRHNDMYEKMARATFTRIFSTLCTIAQVLNNTLNYKLHNTSKAWSDVQYHRTSSLTLILYAYFFM